MTPPPSPQPNPDFGAAAEDFRKGGWIVSLLGGAGMLARMLLADEEHPAVYWIRRIIAGSIVGVLAYFVLWGQPMDGMKKSVILVTIGAFSPEVFEYLRKKYTRGFIDEKEKNSTGRKRKRNGK